ncbi:MAG: hypothetical protein NT129_03535 [Candidatus Aenigmarchaeota archaeon]|nr:hypothetical protein [Candidatus Aenigmarchaeota archaeon]
MKFGKKNRAKQREKEIKEDVNEAFGKKKHSYKKLGIIIIAVFISIFLFAYFFIISPVFVSKPFMTKPAFGGEVETEHIDWVVNELDGYKLHSSLSGETPVMEVIVDEKTFTVTTKDGRVISSPGTAPDPDIRIRTDMETFALLFNSNNIQDGAAKLYDEGKIEITLIKDVSALTLKGYKVIYDAVAG